MDREYFHLGATAEVMEIVRRREKSAETRKFVERRLAIARPGTMRRRYERSGSHCDGTKEVGKQSPK